MKYYLIIFFLLIPLPGNSQVRGTILDKETREPIPYANISIENTAIGTTSDMKGNFHFKEASIDEILVISSVGFEIKYFTLCDTIVEILLQPKTYEIGFVTINPIKNPKKIWVNEIPNRNCSNYLVCSGYPWMSARYFEYRIEYQVCPIIKEIKILTHSEISGSKFNIRIISANENGEPSEDIVGENLIAETKKGKHIITVNIEDLNFRFPKNGFYVAVEWLIINDNKFNFIYTMKGEKEKRNELRYDPKFAAFPKKGTIMTWSYSGGKWKQSSFQDYSKNGEYLDLAIELVLTE